VRLRHSIQIFSLAQDRLIRPANGTISGFLRRVSIVRLVRCPQFGGYSGRAGFSSHIDEILH